MSMSTVESDESSGRFNLPPWAIALIIAAVLGGGGWLLWWYAFGGSGPSEHAIVIQNAENLHLDGMPKQRTPPKPVTLNKDGSYTVRSGEFAMFVTKTKKGTLNFEFFNPGYTVVAPEDRTILRIRRDLSIGKVPSDVTISPAQLAAVKKIPAINAMTITAADQQSMRALWDSYVAAKGPDQNDAEKKVLAALEDIGKRNSDATKVAAAARAKQVAALFTPEQLEALKKHYPQ
jgi:hypothetical protein